MSLHINVIFQLALISSESDTDWLVKSDINMSLHINVIFQLALISSESDTDL